MRDGNHTVAQLMSFGKQILGRRHVIPSVTSTLTMLQIEGTFPTGTHLVTVDQPISSEDGNLDRALYGSFLPVPSQKMFPTLDESEYSDTNMPGALVSVKNEKIVLYKGRKRTKLKVTNKGDRAIQVCSACCSQSRLLDLYPFLRCCADRATATGWIALFFHRSQSRARF